MVRAIAASVCLPRSVVAITKMSSNRLLSYKVLQIQPGAPLLGNARRSTLARPVHGRSLHARILRERGNVKVLVVLQDPEFRDRIDSLDHQIASTDPAHATMRCVAPQTHH